MVTLSCNWAVWVLEIWWLEVLFCNWCYHIKDNPWIFMLFLEIVFEFLENIWSLFKVEVSPVINSLDWFPVYGEHVESVLLLHRRFCRISEHIPNIIDEMEVHEDVRQYSRFLWSLLKTDAFFLLKSAIVMNVVVCPSLIIVWTDFALFKLLLR